MLANENSKNITTKNKLNKLVIEQEELFLDSTNFLIGFDPATMKIKGE